MLKNRLSYRHRHEDTTVELIETLAPKAPPLRLDADGILRVGGTRVTLDSVIGAYEEGATAEAIAAQYDSLSLRDIYGAITYYLENPDEVAAYLRHQQAEAGEVRRQFEARSPQAGIRERLLARRQPQPDQ
jgi:uncharacterized protein (DUF433 family)